MLPIQRTKTDRLQCNPKLSSNPLEAIIWPSSAAAPRVQRVATLQTGVLGMPWQIHGNCLEQMAQRRNIRFMKNVQTVSYILWFFYVWPSGLLYIFKGTSLFLTSKGGAWCWNPSPILLTFIKAMNLLVLPLATQRVWSLSRTRTLLFWERSHEFSLPVVPGRAVGGSHKSRKLPIAYSVFLSTTTNRSPTKKTQPNPGMQNAIGIRASGMNAQRMKRPLQCADPNLEGEAQQKVQPKT